MDRLDTTEETERTASDSEPAATSDAAFIPARGLDLMSVLAPAAPPVPRNARFVAGMGLSKPPPVVLEHVVMTPGRRERKTDRRRPDRTRRNASLWIAAGLK